MSIKQKQLVEVFGVHKCPDEIQWLLESGVQTNSVGLPNSSCPFRIKSNFTICPHNFINVPYPMISDKDEDYLEFKSLLETSEMLQYFDIASEPEHKILYIITSDANDYNRISKLQNIFNPSTRCSVMADSFNEMSKVIDTRLSNSNLSTFSVLGIQVKHLKDYDGYRGVGINSKGRFILVGVKPLKTIGDFCKVIEYDSSINDFLNDVSETKLKQIGKLELFKKMRD